VAHYFIFIEKNKKDIKLPLKQISAYKKKREMDGKNKKMISNSVGIVKKD